MEKVIEDATVLTDKPVNQDNVVEFENRAVCQFCKEHGDKVEVKEWLKSIDKHLIVTLRKIGDNESFCHVHFGFNPDEQKIFDKIIKAINDEWEKIRQK